MPDPPVAVVVSVPLEDFPDEDDIRLTAGKSLCGRLERHLVRSGHVVDEWVAGGCEEDTGVYFASRRGPELLDYFICFWPVPAEGGESQMVV